MRERLQAPGALVAAVAALATLAAACGRHDGAAPDAAAMLDAAAQPPVSATDAALDGSTLEPDAAAPLPAKSLSQYKSVVLCGDSQVGYGHGLTRALAARFAAAGVTKYRWDAMTSASVQSYDEADRLPKLVAGRKPDIVFITIGSNNVQNPHPEGLAGNVRSLAKKAMAGDPTRECYILGPPLPIKGVKKDTGIIQVLAENSAPCKFFDTSKLELSRQKDRIHPDDPGGEAWADALVAFVLTSKEP